jgi:ribosomal-protein-alanine N-acetyltransferase
VARAEGKVVAYIDFWRVGPEAHLITIAVHPDWRKHKIGSRLIDVMLEDARKNRVENVSLDVRPSNAAGLKLYGKYGFRQVGVRKKYYQDNDEDALVLGLSLKDEARDPKP